MYTGEKVFFSQREVLWKAQSIVLTVQSICSLPLTIVLVVVEGGLRLRKEELMTKKSAIR